MSTDSSCLELTPDNPWPGLNSFDEGAQPFFHGRTQEISELCNLVEHNALTVLFGQSGLGKTSLLQAGLFPRLLRSDSFPLYLRLDHQPPAGGEASVLAQQVKEGLRKAILASTLEAPVPNDAETLWEYFFRRTTEFWSPDHRLLTPLLVFDQFEEMFTLGSEDPAQWERSRALIEELSNLVYAWPPKAIELELDATPSKARAYARGQQRCRVILSLREDFLADLDDLHPLLPLFPDNRFRLRRMTPAQALEAIERSGGRLLEPGVARQIVSFVAVAKKKKHGPAAGTVPAEGPADENWTGRDVAPALLSMVCSELNLRRLSTQPAPPRISSSLLTGSGDEIMADFYRRMVADLDPSVPHFLEEELLTGAGFRDSVAVEDAEHDHGLTPGMLQTLEERRLVVVAERFGARRVELTHDLLAGVVKISRDQRRGAQAQREAEEARQRAEEATRRQEELAQELRLRAEQERSEIELRRQEQRKRDQRLGTLSLRIFISSPGDVRAEREITQQVIHRLQSMFAGRANLETYLWEHEPLLAGSSFPENIPNPADCDIFICILWTRLGTRLHQVRSDGSAYESGTEYELEEAIQAYQRTGRPQVLVYFNQNVPLVSISSPELREERFRQFKRLQDFRERWFHHADGMVRAAYTTYGHLAEFEEQLERHLHEIVAAQAPVAVTSDATPLVTWGANPFRGLQRFEFEHAPIFFGRTRMIGEILASLRQQTEDGRAFMLILGASASGKSSLVRAGVLPMLLGASVIEGVGTWRWLIFEPHQSHGSIVNGLITALLGAKALPELTAAGLSEAELAQTGPGLVSHVRHALQRCAQAVEEENRRSLEKEVAKRREEGRAADAAQLEQRLARQTIPAARLVIVVDQMEELFTLGRRTNEEVEQFVGLVDDLARSGDVLVIATMRSDFYPRCESLPRLLALSAGGGVYHVRAPNRGEISQMIRNPALAAGLRFEVDNSSGERLDDILRDAASGDPGMLPLLQLALAELYARRTSEGVLTLSSYRELGGPEHNLAKLAEATFARLDAEDWAAFDKVLLGLVTFSGDVTDQLTRRRLPVSQLDSEAERRVVEAFVAARLFVAEADVMGDPTVTLVSEAVVWGWPRAAALIEAAKHRLRARARLVSAAELWVERGRPHGLLLPAGLMMEESADIYRHHRSELNSLERRYVELSLQRERDTAARRRRFLAAMALIMALLVAALFLIGRNQQVLRARYQQSQREQQAALTCGVALTEWKNGQATQAVETYRRMLGREPFFAERLAALDLSEEDREALKALQTAAK